MAKKRLYTIIMCILLLCLSGCQKSGSIYSNYREVEQIQLIRAMGVDVGDEGVELTISSGKGAEDGTAVLMSRQGASIVTAIDSLQDYASSQELFYGHAKFFLVGQAAAEGGIEEYLGYMERSTVLPMGVGMFVVRGGSAKALMTGSGDADYDISEALSSLEQVVERRGGSHVFTCTDTARALSEYGAALICAVEAQELEGSVFSGEGEVTAVPRGFGVLKNGRLVGFLDEGEAMAACMFIRGGLANVVIPATDGGTVTLTIENSEIDLRPVWEGDTLARIDVDVDSLAEIVEMSCFQPADDQAFLDALGQSLSRELQERFQSLLRQEKELGADFLGLGGKIRDRDARRFDALPSPWLDSAEFSVSVNARVGRTADLNGSVSVNGGGANGRSS